MKEIWKTIKNFENYEISNLGNIRHKKNGILKPQKTIYGYLHILLYNDKTIKNFSIHRLVLSTFKPIEDWEKKQVNHIDHNKENNILENLEWTTAKENCNKKQIQKFFYNSQGCYDENGKFFNSYREAGRFWNIAANTVKNDVLGKTKKVCCNRMTFYKNDPNVKI